MLPPSSPLVYYSSTTFFSPPFHTFKSPRENRLGKKKKKLFFCDNLRFHELWRSLTYVVVVSIKRDKWKRAPPLLLLLGCSIRCAGIKGSGEEEEERGMGEWSKERRGVGGGEGLLSVLTTTFALHVNHSGGDCEEATRTDTRTTRLGLEPEEASRATTKAARRGEGGRGS